VSTKNREIAELTSENKDLAASYKTLENAVDEWQQRALTAEEQLEEIKFSSSNEVSRLKKDLVAVKKQNIETVRALNDRIQKLECEHEKKLSEIYREKAELLHSLEAEKSRYVSSRLELLERDYGLT